ncbi:hypothetical protein OWR29_19450 [Actinoplanes sp. Pm04-4]|uniref:Uncharacterized protein n=1 Tax=Paractinoplanes pyxinae TaxID=2997416 RepID=A0ABT4B114_9ACTN|nr:hypothetical protein [Actinoplanes pyxinae]MCY1140181.1 hypothetical protein [Actinoplanes pyxinae]
MSELNTDLAQDQARRRLKQATQLLHRSAGLPSARNISIAIRDRDDLRDTVSHETVSGILRGDGLPRWSKLECVVRVLAEWATHKPDPNTVVLEVQEMWLACRHSDEDAGTPSTGSLGAASSAGEAELSADEGTGLRVLNEEARISHQDEGYEIEIRRDLRNDGSTPVTGYDVTIVVGRYPEEPDRSREHHKRHPLIWSELAFEAWCEREPLSWHAKVNLANRKEIRVLFENDNKTLPLSPGSSTTMSYSYRVSGDKWGHWFSRRALFPTDRLVIVAEFPEYLRPVVWGAQVEPLMGEAPVHVPVRPQRTGTGRLKYKWQLSEVVVRRSYRLEWGFRDDAEGRRR